jgi:uncharacterized protein YbcI
MPDQGLPQEDVVRDHSERPGPSAEISRGMVRMVRDFAGRGPTKARTTIGRDVITVIMGDTLTKGERRLVEHGEVEHVLSTRHKVQGMMRDDAVDLVESVIGRKVVAFMSDNHVDPDMAAEVFVLEPQPEPAGVAAHEQAE